MHLLAASTLFPDRRWFARGPVSPIPYGRVELKVIVSLTTLVLMIAYLRGGIRGAAPKPPAADDGLLALETTAPAKVLPNL